MVKNQNSKFSEAFAKFNNSSSTGCDIARLSSYSPSKGSSRYTIHGDEVMKASLRKKMMFHDDDSLTIASSHTNLSSSSNHNAPFESSCHAKSTKNSHAESFFMEHLEGENDEEFVRGTNVSLEDQLNSSRRPNDYVGGYSPVWIRKYRRQKQMQQQHM